MPGRIRRVSVTTVGSPLKLGSAALSQIEPSLRLKSGAVDGSASQRNHDSCRCSDTTRPHRPRRVAGTVRFAMFISRGALEATGGRDTNSKSSSRRRDAIGEVSYSCVGGSHSVELPVPPRLFARPGSTDACRQWYAQPTYPQRQLPLGESSSSGK